MERIGRMSRSRRMSDRRMHLVSASSEERSSRQQPVCMTDRLQIRDRLSQAGGRLLDPEGSEYWIPCLVRKSTELALLMKRRTNRPSQAELDQSIPAPKERSGPRQELRSRIFWYECQETKA